LQTYSAKEPFVGKIVKVERIVGPDATGETCNIIIDHGGKMPYVEGQSYGVIPPGKKLIFISYSNYLFNYYIILYYIICKL
jgi:ferredoxin--NADP+ reductase